MTFQAMKQLFTTVLLLVVLAGCNPFAPAYDDTINIGTTLLSDARTYEGIFENMKYAYTFRDTTVYSGLLASNFSFRYIDYERGVEVSWGRDEEMRITYELFQHVQRLDLVWNQIVALSVDSANCLLNVSRNFNLTVTFNPSDIVRIDGYANLQLIRHSTDAPWQILYWKDESNF